MLQICYEKWGQTADSLREQALNSPHPRTRERLLYRRTGGSLPLFAQQSPKD